jgi:exodeoxyribonuclease VII large subunit
MDLRLRFAAGWRRLEAAERDAAERVRLRMVLVRGRLDSLSAQLAHLSPLGILERGYAIVQDESGRVIKEAAAAPVKSTLDVRLASGRLRATVTQSTAQSEPRP